MSLWGSFLDGVDQLSTTSGKVANAVVDWRANVNNVVPANPPAYVQGAGANPDWAQPVAQNVQPARSLRGGINYSYVLYGSLALLGVALFMKVTE